MKPWLTYGDRTPQPMYSGVDGSFLGYQTNPPRLHLLPLGDTILGAFIGGLAANSPLGLALGGLAGLCFGFVATSLVWPLSGGPALPLRRVRILAPEEAP